MIRIKAGLPITVLDDVMDIAEILGAKEKMRSRVEYTKEIVGSHL